jgi:hypothetical protein
MRRPVDLALRGALAASLASTAIAKLLSDYSSGLYYFTGATYKWLAAIELLIVICLLSPRPRVVVSGAAACVIMSAGGIILAFALKGRACGCIGASLRLGQLGAIVIASCLGLLATGVLWLRAGDWTPKRSSS